MLVALLAGTAAAVAVGAPDPAARAQGKGGACAPVAFEHVRRTGGTSFVGVLEAYAGKCSLALCTGEDVLGSGCDMVAGRNLHRSLHRVPAGDARRELPVVAFVRDPREQVASQYLDHALHASENHNATVLRKSFGHFQRGFASFIDQHEGNTQCSEMGIKSADEMRERFAFVGITEEFDESMVLLKHFMLPDFPDEYLVTETINERPTADMLFTPALESKFYDKFSCDLAIYQAALLDHMQLRMAYGTTFAKDLASFLMHLPAEAKSCTKQTEHQACHGVQVTYRHRELKSPESESGSAASVPKQDSQQGSAPAAAPKTTSKSHRHKDKSTEYPPLVKPDNYFAPLPDCSGFWFVHVRKTGGMTLHTVFDRYAEECQINLCRKLQRHFSPSCNLITGHRLHQLLKGDLAQLRALPKVTFLRSPREQLVSQFMFKLLERKHTEHTLEAYKSKFDEFFAAHHGNTQCEDLDITTPEELDYFQFVGLTDQFDESLVALRQLVLPKMNITYTLTNNIKDRPTVEQLLTPDMEAEFQRKFACDIAAFDYAQARFADMIRAYGPTWDSDVAEFKAELSKSKDEGCHTTDLVRNCEKLEA